MQRKTPRPLDKVTWGLRLFSAIRAHYRNFLRSLSSHLRTCGEIKLESTPAATDLSISNKVSTITTSLCHQSDCGNVDILISNKNFVNALAKRAAAWQYFSKNERTGKIWILNICALCTCLQI